MGWAGVFVLIACSMAPLCTESGGMDKFLLVLQVYQGNLMVPFALLWLLVYTVAISDFESIAVIT